jgi:hypothetical protein
LQQRMHDRLPIRAPGGVLPGQQGELSSHNATSEVQLQFGEPICKERLHVVGPNNRCRAEEAATRTRPSPVEYRKRAARRGAEARDELAKMSG